MKASKVLLFGLVGLIAAGVIGGGCAISGYNKAVSLGEAVKSQWGQVEAVLQRRFDLIPNAVETVKGYAKHEKDLLENIAAARTKYFQPGASPADKVQAASAMEGLLSRLLVLKETYPELKADKSFNMLMIELEGSENRISVERQRYNSAVENLNRYTKSFFGRMFAGWAGVEPAEYYKAAEGAKEAPKVNFGS